MVVNAVSVDGMTRAMLSRFCEPGLGFQCVFSESPSLESSPDFFLFPVEFLDSPSDVFTYIPLSRAIAYGPAEELGVAFRLGCGDYLKIPWTIKELALRLERLCSRAQTVNNFELMLEGCVLRSRDQAINLTREERSVLCVLAKCAPNPVPRELLYRSYHFEGSKPQESRSVDMHIHELREKIRRIRGSSGLDEVIYTARPIGYGLRLPIYC